MFEFFAALAIFLASHSIPARPGVRSALVGVLGERLYLAIYGLTSVALLAWLILAAQRAPYIPLWIPDARQYWVPILVMPAALFLLIGGVLAPNPLSVGFRANRFDPAKAGVVGVTRHPILWGFALWAASHVVPNGDLVSVTMFGGFALFALLAMPMIDKRKRRAMGIGWSNLARRTSIVPFGAMLRGTVSWNRPAHTLAATIAITAASYLVLLLAHAALFGPDPTIVLN